MVLVDTDVWSEALRSSNAKKSWQVERLVDCIKRDEVEIIGSIRQEVLSGIRETAQFENIRAKLTAFPDRALTTALHELAAKFFNLCRRNGIQGSHTDFLICAVAVSHKMRILTKDKDFSHYAKHLPIELEEQ